MKMLLWTLAAASLAVASSEPPAPYSPAGWTPRGPRLELPQRTTERDSYLPPRGPDRPAPSYGAPDTDLTVQGLPVQEQTPLFAETPLSGQQYIGDRFNDDLRRFMERQLREKQAQMQKNSFGSGRFDNDNDYDDFSLPQAPSTNSNSNSGNGWGPSSQQPNTNASNVNSPRGSTNDRLGPQSSNPTRFGHPSQFQPERPSIVNPGQKEISPNGLKNDDTFKKPNEDDKSVTESNESAVNTEQPKAKGNVDISKQMLRQLPENYPSQLVQLALQQQYPSVPFSQHIGQLQAPVYYQPLQTYSQNVIVQPKNYEPANFAVVDATLSQNERVAPQGINQQGSFFRGQLIQKQLPKIQTVQIQPQFQRVQIQPELQQNIQFPQLQTGPNPYTVTPEANYQRLFQTSRQVAFPVTQTNQDMAGFFQNQNQVQSGTYQRQSQNQPRIQPQVEGNPNILTFNQHPQFTQPQVQGNPNIPTFNQQPQFTQPQVEGNQNIPTFNQQPQFTQQPSLLQSGFDVNQQGNGLETANPQPSDNDDDNDEAQHGGSSTVNAPGFGDRLPAGRTVSPPRQYGAPPASAVVTETPASPDVLPADDEQVHPEDDGPAVAVATAVADGRRRKPSRLRNQLRNIRPLYTVDNDGQLVQLQ